MGDGLKSVALAAGIMVFFLVVLRGEFVDREWGGRRGISFCNSLSDVWLLGSLPCFLLNLTVVVGTLLAIVIGYGLLAAVFRKLGD